MGARVFSHLFSLAIGVSSVVGCRSRGGDLPSASYRCQTITDEERYQPSALGTIAIEGDRYSADAGGGTFAATDKIVAFSGGPLDGWRAALGKSEAGVYLRFRGSSTGAPGDQRRSGDHLCFVAR